jgi:hypothetical protein
MPYYDRLGLYHTIIGWDMGGIIYYMAGILRNINSY